MKTIKYKTIGKNLKKPEETIINIFPGKIFVRYNIPGKTKSTYDQMRKDGKRGIIFSRGILIQMFLGKTEEEVLEIARKDIKNGVFIADKKTDAKLEITDYEEK